MISADKLKGSIYRSDLFKEASPTPVIEERQSEAGKLRKTTLITGASNIIECSVQYLADTSNTNRKWDEALFRGMCDAVYLVEKEGQGYIVAVEMKSQAIEKAASQVVASMMRYKHMLTAYASFHPREYKAVGIVIHQERPAKEARIDKTTVGSCAAVMNAKMSKTARHCSPWLRGLSDELQHQSLAIAKMEGETWDVIDINDYLKRPFTIHRLSVNHNCEEATVDISSLLT